MSKIPDLDLSDRHVVLTGATGHIGSNLAKRLASFGADLYLIDRQSDDLEELAATIENTSEVNVHWLACDFEKPSKIEETIDKLKNAENAVTSLINNAAFVGTTDVDGWGVPFDDQQLETWKRAFDVNLNSVFSFCQGLSPIMKHQHNAAIVNVASIYGFNAPDWSLYEGTQMGNPAAYAASKGGLLQFTKWLATALAPDIRVNCISPGGLYRDQEQKFVDRYVKRTPLGRMATEDDITNGIVFLVSPMSSYVTGHNLVIDGGWSI